MRMPMGLIQARADANNNRNRRGRKSIREIMAGTDPKSGMNRFHFRLSPGRRGDITFYSPIKSFTGTSTQITNTGECSLATVFTAWSGGGDFVSR